MSCFIIAEAGVNHNGSTKLALELVEVAAHAGADAIKFQTFKASNLVSAQAITAEYQKKSTGITSQFEMLKSLELSLEAHHKIVAHCRQFDIEFMSTGFDEASIDFLCALGIKRLKIPSGEITHHQLLKHVASKNLPIILSTGMSTLEEIAEAIAVIDTTDLTLLHCTSNYPTQLSDVNLKAMQTMATTFNLPVGYSDHTAGITTAPLAVAMGASVIEKHFTLDKNLPGPDHLASLNPNELHSFIQTIRETEIILGCEQKKPCANELAVRDLVRRSITLDSDKPVGSTLSREDIALLRPGTGIACQYLESVIGTTLKRSLSKGCTLQWEDIESVNE